MKVLFAVSNEEISEAIVKKYQKEYKEIISYKNVYYFNAILKEIQKDKTYDRIVISEELEAFTNAQYDQIDKFIFDKLDSISDEAANSRGENTPIILICSDRRTKGEEMLVKLFGIGVYDALLGNDRSVEQVCKLINKSRTKKEAKLYYKIEADEVKYQSENENEVSEQEIQNILAHYKKLGKNEEKYLTSFNNIVAQYNDTQLRIISKYLPLNVRAVLEEKSPKYQEIMSFNNSVTDSIRKTEKAEKISGPSEKLLKTKNSKNVLTGPVIIPSSVDTKNVKKLARNHYAEEEELNDNIIDDDLTQMLFSDENDMKPLVEPKRRGRPKKEEVEEPKVAKKRGRPRKNPIPEPEPELVPEPEIEMEEEEETILPGFDDFDNNIGKMEESTILPGFENINNDYSSIMDNESILPGFENINPKSNTKIQSSYLEKLEEPEEIEEIEKEPEYNKEPEKIQEINEEKISDTWNNQIQTNNIDLTPLLTGNKKIASFVGTSKNGTSFIVNNLAEYASSNGINVAIFDTTQNKNSYYIYTKNEEELRQVASNCLNSLVNGMPKGISVNRNLTVYTSLPEDREKLNNVGEILESLLRMHDLILIDCDYKTPYEYFRNSQDIYLVQSVDILTIQPLTAFLRELKSKNILDEGKIKIILNKYVKVRGISEKTIIGGMSKYNEPSMSFMTDLFDVNTVKYMTIPFEQDIYTRYLESVINCDVSIKGYSKNFLQVLKELNNWVYSMNSLTKNYGTFSQSMNNTLNQMKKKY